MFVARNEIASDRRKSFSGSEADISTFQTRLQLHLVSTETDQEESSDLSDDGEIFSKFSNYWANLADKVYHRLQVQIRIVILEKNSVNIFLTVADKNWNKFISHARMNVENNLGRWCTFKLFSQNWEWCERIYNDVHFQVGVALINASVVYSPLQANDLELYVAGNIRFHTIRKTLSTNLAASQATYRENRRGRLSEGRSAADCVTPFFDWWMFSQTLFFGLDFFVATAFCNLQRSYILYFSLEKIVKLVFAIWFWLNVFPV